MSLIEWSVFTFNERTGRALEGRYLSEDSFLDAAEASLVGGEAEWFVSARLPSGTTLPVELVRELIDIRNADSHKPG